MKQAIETIPVNDAFDAGDECPFCFLERMAEQRTLRYVAGPSASYMEPDVRAATDAKGFCREHTKKLYDYGNSLGAALILQTHYAGILERFQLERENFRLPEKKGLFKKIPQTNLDYPKALKKQVSACFLCDRIEYHMQRYFDTFFVLLKEEEFRNKVASSKGFCLKHFAALLEQAPQDCPAKQQAWFYETVYGLMEAHLIRVKEDLDWFVAKYDYRNAGADWKNSRDALSRAMQKLESVYVTDPPYKKD